MAIIIKEKDRQVIYIAIIVIIIVVDVIFILGWQFHSLFKNIKMTADKRQAIITLENDIRNLDKLKQEIIDLEKKINNLELMIAKEQDVSVLMEDISNLADKTGVKVIQIKPAIDEDSSSIVSAKDARFQEVEIKIIATAGFHQLGNFINKIETADKFFKLSSLEIETDNKDYFLQSIRLSLVSILSLDVDVKENKTIIRE